MTHIKPKDILVDWAKANQISPAMFKKATGYGYQHSWNLLNGISSPTDAVVGKMLRVWPDVALQLSQALGGELEIEETQ